MNDDKTYKVALRCTPIADGMSRDQQGRPSKLHISVLLDLIPPKSDLDVIVDIAELPHNISRMLDSNVLKIWRKPKTAPGWTQLPSASMTRFKIGTNQPNVTQIWNAVMTDQGESMIPSLFKALTNTENWENSTTRKAIIEYTNSEPTVAGNATRSNDWYNRLLTDHAAYIMLLRDFNAIPESVKNYSMVSNLLQNSRADYWKRIAMTFEPFMPTNLVDDSGKIAFDLSKPHVEEEIQKSSLNEEQKEFVRHNSFTMFEPPSSHAVPLAPDLLQLEDVNDRRALDTAKRRWFALNSDPRLQTLLGLCVNFEVDATLFKSDEIGLLTAGFGSPDLSASCQTAYRLSFEKNSFQPASEGEYNGASFDLEFGFLVGSERIHVSTFDTSGAMRSSFAQSANRLAAIAEGSRSDHDLDRMPTLRSAGFELSDSKTSEVILRRKRLHTKTRLEQNKANVVDGPIYFAEDLLIGYRVDIERTDTSSGMRIWSSAVARRLYYGSDVDKFDNKSWNDSRLRHRDDGCIRTLVRKMMVEKTPTNQGDSTVEFRDFAKQEMFLWTGESLGLPNHNNQEASQVKDDLNVGITFDFLGGSDGALPVLRVGDKYRFALRACFRHGGGPEFSRIAAERDGSLHDQLSFGASIYDGRANKEPIPFLPCDPVKSPVLAFSAIDPLSRIPVDTPDNQHRLDRVVLFDDIHNRSSLRILLPPKVSFETAEMQKQFDSSTEMVPRGALRHIERMTDGQLPLIGLNSTRNASSESEQESGFGPVVRAGRSPAASPGYYCDAKGREARIRLLRNGLPCDDLPLLPLVVEFWQENQSPNDAKPIAIEFRRGPSKMRGARFIPSKVTSTNREGLIRNVGGVEMIVVVVEVAPGDEIQAEVWCADHSPNSMFTCNQILEVATKSNRREEQSGAVRRILGVLNLGPSDVLSDKLRIQVLTPVKKPIAPPALVPIKINDKEYAFYIARLVSGSAESEWMNILATTSHNYSLEQFSRAGGDVGYVAGWISVARRSTTTVRIQAIWRAFDDETCLTRVKDSVSNEEQWKHTPNLIVREFQPALATELPEAFLNASANDLSKRDEDGIPLMSIGKNELNGSARNIHFELGTQAIRLGIRLIASSRFRNCFRSGEDTEEGSFDSANYPISSFEEDLPRDDVRVVWLPATERPPQPDLCEPKVELVSRVIEHFRNEKKTFSERIWSFRIRIKKGTWYKSGEGELLGLVFLPEDWVSDESYDDVEVQGRPSYGLAVNELLKADEWRRRNIEAYHRHVTAWAVDPATHAGQLQPTMSPSYFNARRVNGSGKITQTGWVRKTSKVLLPFKVPTAKGSLESVPVNVALLGYSPEIDLYTGERFVDLEIQPPDIDSPFVRLSLVRYQPNAVHTKDEDGKSITDLRASSQVVIEPVQLPSVRTVETEWTEAGLKITIIGPAYNRRSPLPQIIQTQFPTENVTISEAESINDVLSQLESHRHRTDVPWMRIRVMRRLAATQDLPDRFVQAAGDDSSELIREVPSIPNGNKGIWSVTIPIKNVKHLYRIFIEEYEYHYKESIGNVELIETPRAFKIEIDP